MKDGCSSFLCCLLKFKMQVINSENIKSHTGSFLVSMAQDGSRVTRTWAVSGTSHLTSCPPILSLLPLRGALHNSLPAHHGISFTPQTRLREAEDHLRETEGIITLWFFSSDPQKASQASLSSARKKSLLPSLCTRWEVIEDLNSVGAEESFCQHWINTQLPCQQETTPQSQHPQTAQHFLLGLRSQLPLGLQAIVEYGGSSPFSLSCIAIYRSKSVSLTFQSVKYCLMHNQSFSALLEVSRCLKSTSQEEHRMNTQPERAAIALRVHQCPHTKRRVLLPSSQVPKPVILVILFDPSASGMSSNSLMCCKGCNTH